MFNVGSDFSGVGAFDQALIRLGIKYNTIFACDCDKYARETYVHNYGMPEYFPKDVYEREIPKDPLDIYMTSPPCQAFSLAGKRMGENDKRGILFYNSHEFIIKNKPKYFIFENVKGLLSDANGRTFRTWLDMLGGKSVNGNPTLFTREDAAPYHIYYKVLNAKDYGVPQNRERVFIVGIRDDADNNFSFPKPIPLRKRLKDILEVEVDEKYFLSENIINNLLKYNDRQIEKGTGFSAKFRDVERTKIMDALKVGGKGKDDLIKIAAMRGRNPENQSDRTAGAPMQQTLEINQNGVSNTITSVQKDNLVIDFWIADYRTDEGLRIRKDNIAPCMTSSMQGEDWKANRGTRNSPLIGYNYKVRRLTPRECFRLMDFPDSFTWPVSDSQAYKQAGNSIVVNVLVEIIKRLLHV